MRKVYVDVGRILPFDTDILVLVATLGALFTQDSYWAWIVEEPYLKPQSPTLETFRTLTCGLGPSYVVSENESRFSKK